MLAVLLAIVLIVLTLLALSVAGVVAAIIAGVAWLNMSAIILGLRSHAPRGESDAETPERWRPSSFREPPKLPAPPEPPHESDEQSPSLTVHRR
jgi:hypothetical protein